MRAPDLRLGQNGRNAVQTFRPNGELARPGCIPQAQRTRRYSQKKMAYLAPTGSSRTLARARRSQSLPSICELEQASHLLDLSSPEKRRILAAATAEAQNCCNSAPGVLHHGDSSEQRPRRGGDLLARVSDRSARMPAPSPLRPTRQEPAGRRNELRDCSPQFLRSGSGAASLPARRPAPAPVNAFGGRGPRILSREGDTGFASAPFGRAGRRGSWEDIPLARCSSPKLMRVS